MARAVVAGPREKLAAVIETLHEMKLIHIVDHHGEDETFRMGRPLPPAAELSENLVKLRSIANILALKAPPKAEEAVRIDEMREKILTLELNITEEDEARKKATALLSDLDQRIEELRPFADIGLPLEAYRGYDSVGVLVGRITKDVSEADLEGIPVELFQASGVLAVFVPKSSVDRVLPILGKGGFTQIGGPSGEGDPKELLNGAVADREKWASRLEEIEGRLDTLRERYAAFVVSAEEALEVEVDKAEAPLRFAVSDHSFVVDGWVPEKRFPELRAKLEAERIYIETAESHDAHDEAEPPVQLRNPKPAKPFEFLIHLYSTPSYRELDPTLFLFIAAPFFFGFMIGDAGYGAIFIAMGLVASSRIKRESIWWRIFFVTAIGGVWAFLLGFFVFGEAFGMPFHPAVAAGRSLGLERSPRLVSPDPRTEPERFRGTTDPPCFAHPDLRLSARADRIHYRTDRGREPPRERHVLHASRGPRHREGRHRRRVQHDHLGGPHPLRPDRFADSGRRLPRPRPAPRVPARIDLRGDPGLATELRRGVYQVLQGKRNSVPTLWCENDIGGIDTWQTPLLRSPQR